MKTNDRVGKYNLPRGTIIKIVTDNNSIVARSPSQGTTITDMMLHVANNSSFRNSSDRQDISDHQIRLLSAKDELTGVHPLRRHEQLLLMLVAERVTEGHASKWRATAWIVNDLGHNALQIAVAFAEVETTEPGRAFAVVSV